MNASRVGLALLAGVLTVLVSHFLGDFSWGESILYGVMGAVILLIGWTLKARRKA